MGRGEVNQYLFKSRPSLLFMEEGIENKGAEEQIEAKESPETKSEEPKEEKSSFISKKLIFITLAVLLVIIAAAFVYNNNMANTASITGSTVSGGPVKILLKTNLGNI